MCIVLSVNFFLPGLWRKGRKRVAPQTSPPQTAPDPLEAAYAALIKHGLDGVAEALRILVNEAAKNLAQGGIPSLLNGQKKPSRSA